MKILHHLLYWYFVFLQKTVKITAVGREEIEDQIRSGKTCVLVGAHNALLPALLGAASFPMAYLVSRSNDGGLVSYTLEKCGFKVVRGSSSRGQVPALRALTEALKQGYSVGIAVDGPKGPPLRVKLGALFCAQHATGSLFLIGMKSAPGFRGKLMFRINSWDKMLVLLPFSHIHLVFEEYKLDFYTDTEKDDDSKKALLQKLALTLEQRLEEFYGFLYQK